MTMEKGLRIQDVSVITGLSVSHLYKLTSRHEIPYYKIGSVVRFSEDDIRKWLSEKRIYTRKEVSKIASARF